jgi:hypothetical protein
VITQSSPLRPERPRWRGLCRKRHRHDHAKQLPHEGALTIVGLPCAVPTLKCPHARAYRPPIRRAGTSSSFVRKFAELTRARSCSCFETAVILLGCGYSPPAFPAGLLLVPGSTWPVGFQALLRLDRPPVTAKSPGSVKLVPEPSLLRILECMPGFPLLAELLGSHP